MYVALGIRLFGYLQRAFSAHCIIYLHAAPIFFENMVILDILELEKDNKQLILHKEGLFIKAYERSAYLFTKHIKEYKLTKKFYKNVKQEVVQC